MRDGADGTVCYRYVMDGGDMKTKEQIRKYAEGVAWAHFYSDGGTPWEPFEDYEDEWLEEQCANLTQTIMVSMLWAQGD